MVSAPGLKMFVFTGRPSPEAVNTLLDVSCPPASASIRGGWSATQTFHKHEQAGGIKMRPTVFRLGVFGFFFPGRRPTLGRRRQTEQQTEAERWGQKHR